MAPGRGRFHSGSCAQTRGFVGWHFSYFLTTEQILRKLSSFSHSTETFVANTLSSADAPRHVAMRAHACQSIRGIKLKTELLPYAPTARHHIKSPYFPANAELPPLSGWPQQPATRTLRDFPTMWLDGARRTCDEQLKHAATALAAAHNASNASAVASFGPFDQNLMIWAGHSVVGVTDANEWELPPIASGVKAVWKYSTRYHDVRASCDTLTRLLTLAAQNKTAADEMDSTPGDSTAAVL